MSEPPLSAFLFSIEELRLDEGPYNRGPQRAVIGALHPYAAGVRSMLGAGDLILEQMARKLSSVSGEGMDGPLGVKLGPRAAYSFDRNIHMTLVWDLCGAIGERTHDVALPRLAHVLMKHDAFVITVTDFAAEL